MAVVESAADSLSLTLGLAMPRNFSHISPSSDADLSQQQQQQQKQDDHSHHQPQDQLLQRLQFLQQAQSQQHEISQIKQHHIDSDREIKTDLTSLANGNANGISASNGQIVDSNGQLSVSETLIEKQKLSSANGDLVSINAAGAEKNPQAFDMRDLNAALPKLNPLAEEFVPSSVLSGSGGGSDPANSSNSASRKKKNNYASGKRRLNNRANKAQLEECVRRTVYVSDIDQQVTEEQLAALFQPCGQVVDCRVCGDPNSVLRFAFVEFTREEEARAALNVAGTMLGYYPVRVLPSKTAILPVNPSFLPRSENEREMCARTVYCTNIDKKVPQANVKLFFESLCGEVSRLRLLGDYRHSTRIAFVEFVRAESAMLALNCSGAILGSLPLRVSPSKTPVRPRSPRSPRLLSQ